jgi:hypothetical protein
MLPFRLVATFRQQVHVTCQIARVEVFWVDPRQQGHVLVLGPQLRRHPARPLVLHVIDQAADEIGDQVRAASTRGDVLAARQLGIGEIPVMVAAGWTEAQKRAYVLADNQLAITGSGWDPELLRLELGELVG